MVQLQRYLRNTTNYGSNRHLPLLNSLFVDRFTELNPYAEDNNFKTFFKWARRSPQVIGFWNIIATDMLSDRIEFFPVDKNASGRNKVLKAKKFWTVNKGLEVAEETIYDLLGTGIGYNWLGVISDSQLKELCDNTSKYMYPSIEGKELEFKATTLYGQIKANKTEEIPRKLRHIASSTVAMTADEYDIISYVQRVGVNVKKFSPEEIIVYKLMPMDGKIYPFPPMEAILAEVYLLWLISQNYISFFENGGKPDNVFILPKELAGSKNHQYLIETLKKYKKIQNKHGNLVFTGDLSIEKLMDIEHQMENKDLGLYLVGVLAMMYGVPVTRIPFLVGKAAAGGDAGGLADSGYWRKISVWQSKVEGPLNAQLWEPYFGVTMKFRRGYLQDEVREVQNEVQKNSVVEQRLDLGMWTLEEAGKYLNIDEEIIMEAQKQKKERDKEMQENMAKQNPDNNGNVIPEPDNRAKRKKKQDTQLENQKKAGGKKINP